MLNLISDDSVLAFMLARQVAHIVLGHVINITQLPDKSLFDLGEKKNFAGFRIRWRPEEEAAADSDATVLLQSTPYKNAVANANAFLSQLRSDSHRFPNLVRARFGVGVLPEGSLANKELKTIAPREELRFENRYRVSWNRVIVDSEAEQKVESPTLGGPVAVQTSD